MKPLLLLLLVLVPSWCNAGIPEKAVGVAVSLVGTTEATGKNDGPVVEEILRYVGLPKGNPYCAATVVYCYGKASAPAKNPLPKIARVSLLWSTAQKSPRYHTYTRAQVISGVYKSRPGDVFIMLFGSGPNPNGHTGVTVEDRVRHITTIEGNTSSDDHGDQREGGGIYRKIRPKSLMAGIIRIKEIK